VERTFVLQCRLVQMEVVAMPREERSGSMSCRSPNSVSESSLVKDIKPHAGMPNVLLLEVCLCTYGKSSYNVPLLPNVDGFVAKHLTART